MGKKAQLGNNGGVLGSGIFGLFGTTIQCDSKDESIYCNIMKLFNLFIVLSIILIVLYYVYFFITSTTRKSRR